jgi:hypothetical protein
MYTITILNMSHWWFFHTTNNKNITLMHGVQVNVWKLCKITMQGQILLLYLFICYIVLLFFFVVKPINMKSNVCNSLNCSAQYIGCHDWQ